MVWSTPFLMMPQQDVFCWGKEMKNRLRLPHLLEMFYRKKRANGSRLYILHRSIQTLMPHKNKDNFDLKEDGFCFLPSLFSQSEVESAYEGLWEIINGKYRTGIQPENRFWNLGDDPKSIIKIDKPHLCNRTVSILWFMISGFAEKTVCRSSGLPFKSDINTSTLV